jgi:hypothetical protein
MRRILFAVLAVLLLTLQHEGLVHPLVHLGSPSPHTRDTGLAPTQAADTCIECALLAAGGTAVSRGVLAVPYATPLVSHIAYAPPARVTDAPAWFHSRAPPAVA